jgi:hypothetical protein
VGNHEYLTSGAAPYFDYFGSAAGGRACTSTSLRGGTLNVIIVTATGDLDSRIGGMLRSGGRCRLTSALGPGREAQVRFAPPTTPRRRALAAVAGALALAAPAPLAAAPWQPAQRVGPGGRTADARVALDASGTAFAVWVAPDRSVQSSIRPAADGRWPDPIRVSLPGEHVDPGSLRLGVDRIGNATAAWTQSIVGTGQSVVEVAIKQPTRDFWKDPREISGPRMAIAGSSRLAVAPDNAAIVTWDAPVEGGAPDQTAVRASVRPASSGVFGAAQDISAPGVSASRSEVAIDREDDGVAVWVAADGTVQGAERLAGSDWSPPQNVAAFPGTDPASVAAWVALAPAGQGVVLVRAQTQGDPSQYLLRSVIRSGPATPWGAPEDVENLNPSDQLGVIDVGIAPGGEVTMVADHLFPAGEQVDAAVRPAGGWELPIRLATADAVGGPSLAVDGRGCSVAAWTLERGIADSVVQTANRCSGQFFRDAQQLSGSGEQVSAPDVAVNPRGEAAVIWSGNRGVRAAFLTSRHPAIRGFRVDPPAFPRGRGPRLRFALTAPAQVTFTIRRTNGRLLGRLVRHGVEGDNAIPYSGGLRGVPLPVGSYLMQLRADDGVRPVTASTRFTVTG